MKSNFYDTEEENLNIKFIISELHDRWIKGSDIAKFTGYSALNSFLVATTERYMLSEEVINGIIHYKILTEEDFKEVEE